MPDQPQLPEPVEGPSYPALVKLAATAVSVGLATVLYRTWRQGHLNDLGFAEGGFLVAAVAVVASGYWGIMTSRTRIDATHIRQSWLWGKQVALADITQLKLIHVPMLAWIITPRLLVRTGSVGMTTFQAADPRVLAAFRRLAYGEDTP